MRLYQRRATDHRALVLEVIATTPEIATRAEFNINSISAMVSSLKHEGLIAVREDGTLFVTPLGLEWLNKAAFDRALPAPHTKRPGRRKKKVEQK